MKSTSLSLIAIAITLSGCAQIQQKTGLDSKTVSSAGGAAIGCVGGILLAKLSGQNSLGGCLSGAVIGGLVGFEKSRQEEISAAESAKQEAMAALAPLSASKAVKASEVKTVEVTATDQARNETKKFQAFDSVSLEIPLSAKGTPEYETAISKLKTLAEKVADERGSAQIDIAVTSADAKANKIALETASVQTKKGNTITVSKAADNSLRRGIERVTVRAGKIQQTDVS